MSAAVPLSTPASGEASIQYPLGVSDPQDIMLRSIDVLLVEDNPGDADLFRIMLEEVEGQRFRVEAVGSLQAALAALAERSPDVVALDLHLPDSAGSETLERMRAAHPDLPVVALTGIDDRELGADLVRRGAQDFLGKGTFAPETLSRCLCYAIERHGNERALHAAREEAQAAARAKGIFLATMSHEIRTPLSAILGMADVLLASPLNPEQRDHVETFRRCGEGLLGLLTNVLDLSRIEARQLEPARVRFDPLRLLQSTAKTFGFAAQKKGLDLLLDMDREGLREGLGDPDRLRQVLANLLGNAVKFTADGQVTVRARVDAEDRLFVEVEDTGPGLTKEECEAVFERFTQASSEVHAVHGGSGLGLALCRELVSLMGGQLTVASEPGRGCIFRFDLPFPAAGSGALPSGRLDGRSLLLGLANRSEAHVFEEGLLRRGARVEVLEPGWDPEQVAADLAEVGDRPDTVVLDCRLPGGSEDYLERVSRAGLSPETLLILLPRNHRPDDVSLYRSIGARTLMKPCSVDDLAEALLETAETSADVVEPSAASLPTGLRLLVADDCLDNQKVLKALLAREPIQLSLVDDGRQAVERFAAEPFDLILMDMRMPVMDGYAAVAEIRRREQEQPDAGGHVPIVALTADAMPEQRERSLAAGCDAHVAKPLTRDGLVAAILAAVAPEKECEPEEDSGADLIADLVPEFLDNREADLAQLERALTDRDFETIGRLGHNMKGTGRIYGFAGISELGAALEDAAEAADVEAARRHTADLDRQVAQARSA